MLIRCDRLFCCSLADLMAFLKMLLSLLTLFRLVLRFSCKYTSWPHFGGVAFYRPYFCCMFKFDHLPKSNLAVLATSWSNHWFIWVNLSLSRLQGKYLWNSRLCGPRQPSLLHPPQEYRRIQKKIDAKSQAIHSLRKQQANDAGPIWFLHIHAGNRSRYFVFEGLGSYWKSNKNNSSCIRDM